MEIIKTIRESSLILDYDEENETLRLKEGAKLVRGLVGWLIDRLIDRLSQRVCIHMGH